MARLASDANMGYYPTDTNTIKKVIDKTIEFPLDKTVIAVDSCAGKGEAIDFIGTTYGCETYAVELNRVRAMECSKKSVKEVLNCDAILGIRKTATWAGINFLNPPYGTDNTGERLEHLFVRRWANSTAKGGVLILVVNPSSLDDEMAQELRKQGFEVKGSFYDADNEDYQRFGQIFLVLHRMSNNFRDKLANFLNAFLNPIEINSDFEFNKIAITTGASPKVFVESTIPRWKIVKMLEKSDLENRFFKSLANANLMNTSICLPNEGQSALLIAAGALNKEVTLENGTRTLLKGTVIKEKYEIPELNDNIANDSLGVVKVSDIYKTVIYGLDLTSGEFIKYE